MDPVCLDWRELPVAQAVSLVEAEAQAWAAQLDWDVASDWRQIEPARGSGRLPGLVYRARAGQVAGWCCFLVHQHTLQVAMLVAETRDATVALVNGVLASPQAAAARSHALCVREGAPGLRQVLGGRGFSVATYRYLSAPIGIGRELPPGVRPWRTSDVAPTARLCARAYARSKDVRAFAVHGTPVEWQDYTEGLVMRPGCGQFLPDASFVVDVPPSREASALVEPNAEIDGAIVTTDLGAGTAHVAQIAVDPLARGLGFGRALMTAAMARAATRGLVRMTLLVAEANAPAVRLYEELGFRDQATFVVAVCRQPRRSTSVALATGGASTRR